MFNSLFFWNILIIGVTSLLGALGSEYKNIICIVMSILFIMCIHLILTKALGKPYHIETEYRVLNADADIAEVFFDLIPMHIGGGHVFNIAPVTKTDVHDNTIQQSIVLGITALKQWYSQMYGTKPFEPSAIDDIKEYIFNGYDGSYKNKEAAYSTLKSIQSINGLHHNINMHELDVLLLVWLRICDPVNIEVIKDLKSNLVESMADGTVTIDSPYCLTGRITHIVQALESIDRGNIVNIKSTDSIKDEISSRIAHLRTDFFNKHKSLETLYNNDSEDEPTRLVNEQLKSFINNTLREEYILTNIITEITYSKITVPLFDEL